MHLVMPWFFPLASLVTWLGFRTTKDARAEGPSAWATACWLRALMALPLLFWLITQFTSDSGALS